MPRKAKSSSKKTAPPARSPENRENQLIDLAYSLVEERLRNGTASAQETVHFLRLGTTRARLEQQKVETETELLKAKQKMIESAEHTSAIYQEAIDAMKRYSGHTEDD